MFKINASCFFAKNKFIKNTALHILHVSSAKSWRGGERQISFLIQELNKKNIKQKVLCMAGSRIANWCNENKVEYFTYQKVFSLNPLVAYKIKKLDSVFNFSHIHTHDSHSHTFAVIAASLFNLNKKLIVHRRVDFPLKDNLLSRWKYNHPAIKAIICVSEFIKKLIEPAIKSNAKIVAIHSGIDLSVQPETNGVDLRKEFKVPKEHFIIINLSAIAPHKDYFTFVNTAEVLLRDKFPATFLLIGGDGGEAVAIQEFIDEKGISENLIMTGFRKDVSNILAQSDLLLFTSKTEGLGGATLDALLAGLPIVSTAVGGAMEVVEDEKTGLVAPIGDANKLAEKVKILLGDKNLQKKLIANGKEKVKLFSKEKNAEKILKVYLIPNS